MIRSVSSSNRKSAVTRTFEPVASTSRERPSTSEKNVTSQEPAASEMRTQAMRLPVRVMRSFEAMTLPASFTRVMPRAASVST